MVDDHPIVLSGVGAMIDGQADLTIVGLAANAEEALDGVALAIGHDDQRVALGEQVGGHALAHIAEPDKADRRLRSVLHALVLTSHVRVIGEFEVLPEPKLV